MPHESFQLSACRLVRRSRKWLYSAYNALGRYTDEIESRTIVRERVYYLQITCFYIYVELDIKYLRVVVPPLVFGSLHY